MNIWKPLTEMCHFKLQRYSYIKKIKELHWPFVFYKDALNFTPYTCSVGSAGDVLYQFVKVLDWAESSSLFSRVTKCLHRTTSNIKYKKKTHSKRKQPRIKIHLRWKYIILKIITHSQLGEKYLFTRLNSSWTKKPAGKLGKKWLRNHIESVSKWTSTSRSIKQQL